MELLTNIPAHGAHTKYAPCSVVLSESLIEAQRDDDIQNKRVGVEYSVTL